MQIRKMTLEENAKYRLLGYESFLLQADDDYTTWSAEKFAESTENYIKLGAFDDSGELLGGLYVLPYEMQFDNKTVRMAGIQGVLVAPEARDKKIADKLMRETLRIIRQEGFVFSALYPFSYAYYRRFGYEVAHEKHMAKIPLEDIPFPFPQGKIKFWKKDDDPADIREIYSKFAQNYNLAIVRNDEDWTDILDGDPYLDRKYTYIHYDTKNSPTAYLRFETVEGEDSKELLVMELAYIDKFGLIAMLGFVARLRSQFGYMNWDMPSDVDLYSILPEAWNLSITTEPSIMLRIVDVKAALENMHPHGDGAVIVEVADEILSENTGKYSVSWENGKTAVRRTGKKADISTSIEGLAQLIIGYTDPSTYHPDTVIHNHTPHLTQLFHKKNRYIWEKF